MKEDLIKHGCIPRKSLVLKFPKTVPIKLLSHFLRGNFDGDGCITESHGQLQAFFLGTRSFLLSTLKILKGFGVNCNKIQKKGNIFRLRITGIDNLTKLKKWMYKNSKKFLLKRKFNKFN
jgi:intein/homing endonuclease